MKPSQYYAMAGSPSCIENTETAEPSAAIAEVISEYLGVVKRATAGDILYRGDQFHAGKQVDRNAFSKVLQKSLRL